MTIALPVINLNGTSKAELLALQVAVLDALSDAMTVLQNAAPNGRDYQTALPGTYELARDQHAARWRNLYNIRAEIELIAESIAD